MPAFLPGSPGGFPGTGLERVGGMRKPNAHVRLLSLLYALLLATGGFVLMSGQQSALGGAPAATATPAF